jgi:hypothetical protein
LSCFINDFMRSEKKELRQALKLAIKGLILQEARLLQLESSHPPAFILDEMARSIQEAKSQVRALVRFMPTKERNTLIKRFVRESVHEEIDQAIQVRKTRCFRCLHVRYFDEAGSSHVNLPSGIGRAHVMGCEITPAGIQCENFIESSMAVSMEAYLNEMVFLYEVKERFEEFEELWDYLTK